jgi:hypothetical protein
MNFKSCFNTKPWIQNGWLQVTDSAGYDAGIVVKNLSKSGYGFARSLHQINKGKFL